MGPQPIQASGSVSRIVKASDRRCYDKSYLATMPSYQTYDTKITYQL